MKNTKIREKFNFQSFEEEDKFLHQETEKWEEVERKENDKLQYYSEGIIGILIKAIFVWLLYNMFN